MNVVKEINKINQAELDLGVSGSWHDEYKDSAYIFIGGLPFDLTEGDVITIFSQYGEVMDLNMPRDKETGKTRGFGFLMYEDQRSTILAVDNLNGAKVLEKTLRVDHVKSYTQPKIKGEDGEWVEPEEQSLNAKPMAIMDELSGHESSASSAPSIDPEDPMRDYLLSKRKEEKALRKKKKTKSDPKGKHKDETPEERRARKAKKRERKARKAKSEGVKAVEDLLNSLGQRDAPNPRSMSPPPDRYRSSNRSQSPSIERRRMPASSRSRSPPDGHSTRNKGPMKNWAGSTEQREPHGSQSRSRNPRDQDRT